MKAKVILFDWAGTIVDFGSKVPEKVFHDTFDKEDIYFTGEQIRSFMGMNKRDHIRELFFLDGTIDRLKQEKKWQTMDDEAIVDAFYDAFNITLLNTLKQTKEMIPGADALLKWLHQNGYKTGSSTGYNREMLSATKENLVGRFELPQVDVAADDVAHGRPEPDMLFAALEKLSAKPDEAISVGDTLADCETAKRAGIPFIGVIEGSSLFGVSLEDFDTMSEEAKAAARTRTRAQYFEAGATDVIQRIGDLQHWLEDNNA